MADACPTCGRPKAHKRAHPCDRTVCWTCPESATLPALDCDGNEVVVDWRARALAAESALAAMRERAERAERQRGEARMLLIRMVKYCREDKATTARATRLERLVEQVADYLNRTHDPADIPRCEDGKAGGA